MSDAARIGDLEHQVQQLQQQVKALTKRVAKLEEHPNTGASAGKPTPR